MEAYLALLGLALALALAQGKHAPQPPPVELDRGISPQSPDRPRLLSTL
jgi:hypothetical protein